MQFRLNKIVVSNHRDELLTTASKTIPFLMEDSLIQRLENNDKSVTSTTNHDSLNNSDSFNDLLPIDMDMDSPFSPQSSEGSDIFEPPMPTPTKGKRKQINGNVSSSTKASRKNKRNKGMYFSGLNPFFMATLEHQNFSNFFPWSATWPWKKLI